MAKLLPLLLPNDATDSLVREYLAASEISPVLEKIGLFFLHDVGNPPPFFLRVSCAGSFEQVVDFHISSVRFGFHGLIGVERQQVWICLKPLGCEPHDLVHEQG